MFDLIIIGGGPAGYHAAEISSKNNLKTALFEKRALGGVCLNEGCIPSKALLHSAKVFDYSKSKAYGVSCVSYEIDYPAVIKRKDGIVRNLVTGIKSTLKKSGVEIIKAQALISGRTENGFEVEADGKIYEAKNILIASGSEAMIPPIDGLKDAVESGFAITNREILALTEAPKKIAIVGGGVIGLEMASFMASVGAEVVVIEMLDKIAGQTDTEISELLQKVYTKKGVKFELGAKVSGFENGIVYYEKDGKKESYNCDKALISIGRRAVTKDMGFEKLGILMERGAIVTDETQKTNIPGIFATGDVNGKSMLAHTAYRESEVAINTILGIKDRMEYNAIPSVIYTNPEVASIGETLETAQQKGMDVHEIKLPMVYSGRFLAENSETTGICKLILEGEKIVGLHMIGNYSSEIISTASVAISTEMSVKQFKKVVFPHPTVGEIIHEALFHI